MSGGWTPGPWEARSQPWSRGQQWNVGRAEVGPHHTLARVLAPQIGRAGEQEANAALIAASPALYEALAEAETALDHELRSLLDSVCLHDCNGPVRPTAEIAALPDVERLESALDTARAALSLATGETE